MQTVTKAREARIPQKYMTYQLFVKQLKAIPMRLTSNSTSAMEMIFSFNFIKLKNRRDRYLISEESKPIPVIRRSFSYSFTLTALPL